MSTVEKSRGLILRVRTLTETSLIIHWLTPDLGRIATVAKGARRPKSALRGKLDLFHVADFSFVCSRRSELHTLREAALVETHAALRRDLACLQQASYAVALLEQTTETETPIPFAYDLALEYLQHLCREKPQAWPVFALEMKLLAELGFTPELEMASVGAEARTLLEIMMTAEWAELAQQPMSPTALREIRQFLHGFLIFHLGRVLPTRGPAMDLPG